MFKREFTDPSKCMECHSPLDEGRNVGGWKHHKIEDTYISGALCKRCSSNYPPKTQRIREAQRMMASFPGNWKKEEEEEKEKAAAKPKPATKKPKIPSFTKGKAAGWLSAWFDDIELRKSFNTFEAMKNFANEYGYGSHRKGTLLKHIKDMKRHKRIEEESQ